MTRITIREVDAEEGVHSATVSFDGEGEYAARVADPFSPAEEARLEWYFEKHLRFPFTGQVDARRAADSISAYGKALFGQVFAEREAYAHYREALQAGGAHTLRFEIAGSPEFHRLHWESLRDPSLPRPLALDASVLRRNLVPPPLRAVPEPSPTINLLVVTARPHGERDVGYRTISRPLVEGLRQARLPVRVDVLRPGTYRALSKHLESVRGPGSAGYYHVVHFDVHGALLTHEELRALGESEGGDRYVFQARDGRQDLAPYEGRRAFLFLEGDRDEQADPVEAAELSALLLSHRVPIAVLNACESGKQVGSAETSLGSRLMQAGMQTVLAMGYSVTVSAAEMMMRELYGHLFAGRDLATAIRLARLELHDRKGRRVYFNQTIDLEDWLLPVVYENQAPQLRTRDFTPEEAAAYYEREAAGYTPPDTAYGFVGRDLDVLRIEKRLLSGRNLLLVRGMGGAGKSTLLHHLGGWWQATRFVDRVFYFGYDERAWTRQQLLHAIAGKLLPAAEFHGVFVPMKMDAQQAMLVRRLRAERHLLILDNLESITGTNLAVGSTLPPEEREALRRFLADLAGGRTLVLLGSRSGEEWLAPGTFGESAYDLPGLDPEAASVLADRILERHGAARYRGDDDYRRLLRLLAGYPLAMEVVLANLARQTPVQVLEALQAGDVALDTGDAESKTRSILRCIDYSHGNLDPDVQGLLACLAPFTSVLNTRILPMYSEVLRSQDALSGLPFERWDDVIRQAVAWGLMSPYPEVPGFLRLQPALPYFLRNRLGAENDKLRDAVDSAFQQTYDGYGDVIYTLMTSKAAGEKTAGRVIAGLEFENLYQALGIALNQHRSILKPYSALSEYFDSAQEHSRGLALGETILASLAQYPSEILSGVVGLESVGVLDDVASRQLRLKRYAEAEETYRKTLDLWQENEHLSPEIRKQASASIYHQLGMVAQAQRQWEQAEQHYRHALEVKIEFKDRDSQASTYHQLGMVAQAQRQWEQAEQHYRQALEVKIEFNDRHSQASTYHQLGMVAQEQRQWEQAEHHYRQALEIYIEFNDRYEQAGTYHQLGRVAEEQRQWEQAEQYYRQALEVKIEFNDRHSQASTYHQLGMVAQEQRQWEQAEHHYRQALEIYIEFNDRYEQAGTYHQLGRVAEEQRQWEQAEQHYRQALEIKIGFKDRYSQASTYHQLGRVAQAQRQWEQAQTDLLQALEIFLSYKEQHNASIALRTLANLWKDSGDDGVAEETSRLMNATPEQVRQLFESILG